MPNGPQQLARTRFERERIQHLTYGLKADRQIVAVVAVSKHGVQSGQVLAMTLDGHRAAIEVRAYLGAVNLTQNASRRMRTEWQRGASVAALSSRSNDVWRFIRHVDDSLLAS
jgi:nucleoside diphosphate kinase